MVSRCRNCNVTSIFHCILLDPEKLNSFAYITKTYHEGNPLPIGTFVLKRHFAHVYFSDKPKPLRIGPYKILDRLSDVTYELLAQDGSTLHVHRNHLMPYYPKEPLLYPHLRHFMRFSDSINYDNIISNPLKYANSDSSPFNSNESLADDPSSSDDQIPHKLTSFKTHQLLILRQILPHLSNKSLKFLIIINFLTEPVNHLKTNQHLLYYR